MRREVDFGVVFFLKNCYSNMKQPGKYYYYISVAHEFGSTSVASRMSATQLAERPSMEKEPANEIEYVRRSATAELCR